VTGVGENDGLVTLVYELLDAHRDTVELAADLAFDETWQAHLDYLRALSRTGREMVAHASLQGQT
jgi:hypothetical protein